MGLEQYFSVYQIGEDSIAVGKFNAQRIGKIIRVNGLPIVFSNPHRAKEVFEEVKQNVENLTPDSSVVLYKDKYSVIALPISAVWEYNWVHTTDGNIVYPDEDIAEAYFNGLVSKLEQTKVVDILPSVGGKASAVSGGVDSQQILQQVQGEIDNALQQHNQDPNAHPQLVDKAVQQVSGQIDQKVQQATQGLIERVVWKRVPQNPSFTDVPPYPNTMWINTQTGEIFVHIKNCQSGDKAIWKGVFGTEIYPNTLDVLDIFGDNSALALWKFDGDLKDVGGKYDAQVQGGSLGFADGRWGQALDYPNIGTSPYVVTPTIQRGGHKGFTVSFWLYVYGHTGNWVNVIHLSPDGQDMSGNSRQPAIFLHSSDNRRFHIRNDGVNTGNLGIEQSQGMIEYQKWHHIVLVVEPQRLRFYIDKELTDTYDSPEEFKFNDGVLFIGDKWYRKNYRIDQLRLINRVITDDEVAKLYDERLPC